MYKSKFKKFGGDYITDIVQYIKEYLEMDPTATITVSFQGHYSRFTEMQNNYNTPITSQNPPNEG